MSATVKTINTGVLAIAYLEYGPASGWPCIMGHGFPYDAHAYDQAAPILAQAGRRPQSPAGAAGGMGAGVIDARKMANP
jgi:pimeloyl-ACP methyl ester carboxylesterase